MTVAAKLDKKFDGDIHKVKDHTFVPPDEYLVFLAKDNAFAATLPEYRRQCEAMGADPVQLWMVDEMIANVEAWRAAHPERCKVPDAAGEQRLL